MAGWNVMKVRPGDEETQKKFYLTPKMSVLGLISPTDILNFRRKLQERRQMVSSLIKIRVFSNSNHIIF